MPLGVLIESALDHLFVFVTRETSDLPHAQTLHETIEKNIRLQRPGGARSAVRRLLANTDEVIGLEKRGRPACHGWPGFQIPLPSAALHEIETGF